MSRKYEYACHGMAPLPPRSIRSASQKKSPVMNEEEMEWWLNSMDEEGWEFMGFGQKHWKGSEPFTQTWWIFRRPVQ